MPSDSETEPEQPTPTASTSRRRLQRGTSSATRSLKKTKPEPESDEQEGEAAPEESEEEEEREKPAKRRKLKRDSEAQDEQGSDAEEAESDDEPAIDVEDVKRKPIRDPKDGYEMGAITRIACKNFMTYDFVECTPGPHLNMVIGPNGTGKSTIVSAIALGLGYTPKELGRAKNISEFVKKGSEGDAWLELEVKNQPGKKNIFIKRHLNAEDNSSKFELNGKSVTAATVKATVQELNAQVDNLCCFLPQERVAEFARLNPHNLLRETQRTAGHKQLTEWHDQLITDKQRLLSLRVALEGEKNVLKREEEANRTNERDVRRYEERQGIEKEIRVLEVQIPFSKYSEIRTEVQEEKEAVKEIKIALKEKEAENAPFVVAKQTLKNNIKAAETKKANLAGKMTKTQEDQRKKQENLNKANLQSESLREELERIATDERARLQKIRVLEREITRLEEQTSEANKPDIDLGVINVQITQVQSKIRALTQEIVALQEQQTRIHDVDKQVLYRAIEHYEEQIKRLESVQRAKEERVKRERAFMVNVNGQQVNGMWEAILWLRANQDKLQDVVYEPVRLVANSKTPEAAKYLESLISWDRSKTFLCRTNADYDLLTNEWNTKRKWRVNVASMGDIGPLDSFRPPIPTDQLKRLGFDGYGLDLLEAPDDMKRYLCDQANLHQIPVSCSDRELDASSFENPNSGIRRYIAGGMTVTFGFSAYGDHGYYSTNNFVKAPTWCGQMIDMDAKNELLRQIEEKRTGIADLDRQLQPLRVQESEIRERHAPLKEEKEVFMKQKKQMEDVLREYQTAKVKLTAERKSLDRVRQLPSGEEKERNLRNQLRKLAHARLNLAKNNAAIITDQIGLQSQISYNTLELLESQAKLQTLVTKVAASSQELVTMKEEYEARQAAYMENVGKAKEMIATAQAKLNATDEDTQGEYERRRTEEGIKPAEELEAALHHQQVLLDSAAHIGAGVIRQYEQRLAKINGFKEKIAEAEKKEASLAKKVDKIQKKYVPAVEGLVDQVNKAFTEAFEAMGCTGEVALATDEDYAKWGIQVLVSFRDGAPLEPLTGTKQSGGERSLSTILYLMSLTKLATAPFSLVDEINQGMDARAERAVMDLLVKNVCEEGASQYFIITPKLLQGLTYAERMKVLCVNNGEWLPDAFDMKEWIGKRQKARKTNGI